MADDDNEGLSIPLPDGVDPDDDEVVEPTAEDIAQQIIDLESQQRLWLGVCLKLMQVERKTDESNAVARASIRSSSRPRCAQTNPRIGRAARAPPDHPALG